MSEQTFYDNTPFEYGYSSKEEIILNMNPLLKELMEKYKFKQIRFIEWLKTNPMPLNQSVNYLTNCREIALLGIKKSKPTFNSKYDKGVYEYPIQTGKKGERHPTQKNLLLFEELIKKHSND